MKYAKDAQMRYIRAFIERDQKLPIQEASKRLYEQKNQNLTRNDQIMYLSFFMSAMELVVTIFIFSYFCGIAWYLGCELMLDFIDDLPLKTKAVDL